jgi:predicted protein tyrosine phosphatase
VRSLSEAKAIAAEYPLVLTVGPSGHDVAGFNHPNHVVLPFADTTRITDPRRPRRQHVDRIVEVGAADLGPILVHCHAGISRSTASALAILLARNVDPEVAVKALVAVHPEGRPFVPNDLIVAITAEMFDLPDLPELVISHERYVGQIFKQLHPLKYAPNPKLKLGVR